MTVAPLFVAVGGALAFTVSAPAPPRPALTASPSRIVLNGAAKATVHLIAPRGAAVVDVTLTPYVLDLRGRPRLDGAQHAPGWVVARPSRLRVGAKGASVTLTSRPAPGTAPGDRPFALVLTTARTNQRGVAVRLRVGVFVLARVPGKVVRKLVIGPLKVRRPGRAPVLELTIRNSGNVAERLAPGRLVLVCAAEGGSSPGCVPWAGSCSRTAARSSALHIAVGYVGRRRFRCSSGHSATSTRTAVGEPMNRALRSSHIMRFVDPGAIVECDGRTQVALICGHMGATEDAAARRRAGPDNTTSLCESF